jgi:hypothetical protein
MDFDNFCLWGAGIFAAYTVAMHAVDKWGPTQKARKTIMHHTKREVVFERETPDFKRLWKGIINVWMQHPHCMYYGCGKETFANWYAVCNGGRLENPKDLRWALDEAVNRGLLDSLTSLSGHPTYWPLPKAGLPAIKVLDKDVRHTTTKVTKVFDSAQVTV